MKILHIAPTPFFADRGCHIRILGEVDHLREMGHEVLIVTYHIGRNVKDHQIKRIVSIPWYKKLEAGGSWHKLYLDVLLFGTSFTAFRKFQPDVIHGHLHEGALLGWLLAHLGSPGRTPVIFDVQGSLSGELESYGLIKKNSFLKTIFLGIEKLVCKLPDYFVCSSEENTELIHSVMGIPKNRVITVSDGIDPNFFETVSDCKIREALGVEKSKKIVLYTGSLMKSKGIDYLIKAIPLILQGFENVHFVFSGHPIQPWLQRTHDLKIDGKVHFTGKVDFFELPKYLKVADVAVDPKMKGTSEGSGKIVNYMGAGLPVVCFDTTNNRKLLGDTGFFAHPGDANDLADKIIKILTNDDLAKTTGAANRQRVNTHFSWQAAGKLLSDVYKQAVDNIQAK